MALLRDRLQQTAPAWRKQNAPPEAPEDSVLMRILVQLMVCVGILATDVAAETQLAIWAIPVSFLGAYWSWRQRKTRQIGTQFLLAIGMIVALILFFMGALARREQNDLRLVLVELLVQVQTLHSFDMPRRKDLGYSMMIGLILLGVASTLSQTIAFGGMLIVFLAIALPVLILDYRSRLGLKSGKWQSMPESRQGLRRDAVKLASLLAIVVALGLTLFALMPRFSGYQLRSLPMSAPLDVPARFDNQQITSPGYGDGNTPGNRRSRRRGNAPRDGKGEADAEFYAGFGDRINQNLRGELKPKLLMRVRSQAAGFWRMQAFDRYTGQGWEISDNEKTQTLRRTGWANQFDLPTGLTLAKRREIIQTYTIVAEMPNLIPVLFRPRELFFPTFEIAIDRQGGLRAPVPLDDGITYTVISDVPYRDRNALQKAKSKLPPASGANPKRYQQLPEGPTATRLRAEAQRLLATANQPITSDYEKTLYLAQALKQRYSIQQDLPFFESDQDLAVEFLTKYRGGYPDHFSTTLTALLRSIGISARLVTGFMPGQFNAFTGLYEVKNTDAVALTEVFFEQYGWFTFDPVPGRPLIPPSIEEDQTFSALKQFWNWVAGWLPSPVMGWFERVFGGLWQQVMAAIGWFAGLFLKGIVGWLTAALVSASVGFGIWTLWRQWQRWRYSRRLQQLPEMEQIYQRLSDWLAQQGMPRQPAWTPLEYGKAIEQKFPQFMPGVDMILQRYVQWRYGAQEVDSTMLKNLLESMKRSQQPSRNLRFSSKFISRFRFGLK